MTNIGNLAVGTRVSFGGYLFIVLHHGKPSSIYDDSFIGKTILMSYNSIGTCAWMAQIQSHVEDDNTIYNNVYNKNYGNSDVRTAAETFVQSLLSPPCRGMVAEVKLPYFDGSTLCTGSAGLSAKGWVPSIQELYNCYKYSNIPKDGAVTAFWNTQYTDSDRASAVNVRDDSGRSIILHTRTCTGGTGGAYTSAGLLNGGLYSGVAYGEMKTYGHVLPCIALKDTESVKDSVVVVPTSAGAKIAGVWKSGTPYIKTGGVWKSADSIHTKIGGAWRGQ